MELKLEQICSCTQRTVVVPQKGVTREDLAHEDMANVAAMVATAYFVHPVFKTKNPADVIEAFCQAMREGLMSGDTGDEHGICLHRCGKSDTMFGGPVAKYIAAALIATGQKVFDVPEEWLPEAGKRFSAYTILVETNPDLGHLLVKGGSPEQEPQKIYSEGDDALFEAIAVSDSLVECLSNPKSRCGCQAICEAIVPRFGVLAVYFVLERIRRCRTRYFADLTLCKDGRPCDELSALFERSGIDPEACGRFPYFLAVHVDYPTHKGSAVTELWQ